MENVILIALLVAILGGAVAYIVKAKRNGVKCIGCSAGGSCGAKKGDSLQGGCGSCSGCTGCDSYGEHSQTGCGCGGSGDDAQESCGCHEETK